jgi:MFS family permease
MRTASALVEVPTMYFASKLGKKIDQLGVFSLSVLIFAVAWYLFSIATRPWMLIAITAFRGLGFGFAVVSAVTYLDSKARVSEAASYQGLYSSLVLGVAPMLAGPLFGFLAGRVGLAATFRYASLVGALGLVFLVAIYGIRLKRGHI